MKFRVNSLVLLLAASEASMARAETGDAGAAAQANNPLANMTAFNIHHYYVGEIFLEMEQPERAVKELAAIKELGVGIALDDFGTGYSSFSYLYRFPIDTLKIDRSFIHNIGLKEETSELVAAIIAMAHILKLRVVAEGIETGEQLEVLTERDCDVIQGFLFKPPVAADAVPELLLKRTLKSA